MDLLEVKEGIICHQCNSKGVMGKGLALSIKVRFPENYKVYKEACKIGVRLGDVIFYKVTDQLYIANLIGQARYGYGTRLTDYDALWSALVKVKKFSQETKLIPYFPFGMGSGLGGGNWEVISEMIEDMLEPNKFVVCKLGE